MKESPERFLICAGMPIFHAWAVPVIRFQSSLEAGELQTEGGRDRKTQRHLTGTLNSPDRRPTSSWLSAASMLQ